MPSSSMIETVGASWVCSRTSTTITGSRRTPTASWATTFTSSCTARTRTSQRGCTTSARDMPSGSTSGTDSTGRCSGRFTSKPIDSDGYLLQASRYVHRNPLDLGPVTVLSTYPWSSYAAYLGRRRPPRWLHRSTVLDLAGDAMHYRSYVETESPSEETPSDQERSSAVIRAIEARVAAIVDDGAQRTRRWSRPTRRWLATWSSSSPPKTAVSRRGAWPEHYGLAATSVWSAVDRTRSRADADRRARPPPSRRAATSWPASLRPERARRGPDPRCARQALGRSLKGTVRSLEGSRGRPRARWARLLRWTSLVPPPIRVANWFRNCRCQ